MSGAAAPTTILDDLVEDSLEEADFLWGGWEAALGSHALGLDGVASWVEERLLGSLDGVILAGDAAIDGLLAPAIDGAAGARLSAAVFCLASLGTPAALGAVARAFEGAGARADGRAEDRLAAFRRAFELVPSDLTALRLEPLLASAGPAERAALLDLRSFRRRPQVGADVADGLRSAAPPLRCAALRAVARLPGPDALREVEAALADVEPACAAAAVEAGLRLGSLAAWARCRELARGPGPAAGAQLSLLAALGGPAEHDVLFAALAAPALRRRALRALGFAGTRAAADACLEAMSAPADARVAAESFASMTGLDLAAERLVAPEPPEAEEPVPFEDDDLDADLVPAADDLLPLPDLAGVGRWWQARRAAFQPGRRYLGGRPATLAALHDQLERGPMRRRADLALELNIRTAGLHDVEARAFTTTQRRQLQASRPALIGLRPTPLARAVAPL
jgi:uncharacterized protein (TIGR02270 family)